MTTQVYRGMDARFNEYPILEVLFDLGIQPKSMDGTLVGSLDEPVLDIGCGRHAYLVEHLIHSGLRAEGIDPEILEELASKPYLMKQDAQKISREDRYYGTVVTHMGPYQGGMLFAEMNDREGYKKIYQSAIKPELMNILKETKRVLRPGGRFIINPLPGSWMLDVGKELKNQGYDIAVENVLPIVKRLPPSMAEIAFEYMKRLVLTTPR